MNVPSKEVIKHLRSYYPIGARVELIQMDDITAPLLGPHGTLLGVDDIGSLMVAWYNGSRFSVVYGAYRCRVVAG